MPVPAMLRVALRGDADPEIYRLPNSPCEWATRLGLVVGYGILTGVPRALRGDIFPVAEQGPGFSLTRQIGSVGMVEVRARRRAVSTC